MKITPMYLSENLLSGKVVCNCIFRKYFLYNDVYLLLHKMLQITRIVLNKTTSFY